jgi:hypothetical protein
MATEAPISHSPMLELLTRDSPDAFLVVVFAGAVDLAAEDDDAEGVEEDALLPVPLFAESLVGVVVIETSG